MELMREVTICIATHNRVADLRRLLLSTQILKPSVPVLVYDDYSSDGTTDVVRSEFPDVRLITGEKNIGTIAARNICIREANSRFVMILDDDAYFVSSSTVKKTIDDFSDPRIAAVAVPFKEKGRLIQGSTVLTETELVRSFVGAVQMLRRDVILECGGFREGYDFYCEEPDLGIRLLNKGFVVRHGTADPAVHEPNINRNPILRRQILWLSENRFKWYYTPTKYLFPSLFAHWIFLFQSRTRFGGFHEIWKMAQIGRRDLVNYYDSRCPVKLSTYRIWRRLAKAPRLTLSEAKLKFGLVD